MSDIKTEYPSIDKVIIELKKTYPDTNREFVREYFAHETASSVLADNEVWSLVDELLGDGLKITMKLAEEWTKERIEEDAHDFVQWLIDYRIEHHTMGDKNEQI